MQTKRMEVATTTDSAAGAAAAGADDRVAVGLVASLSAGTGNCSTANRIAGMLTAHGFRTVVGLLLLVLP